MGFRNDYLVVQDVVRARMYGGLASCMILLKLVKYFQMLIPRMGLIALVLDEAKKNLFLFSVIFCINIAAFATSFALLVGANVQYYVTITYSFMALLRAMVGDYDLDDMAQWGRTYLVEWFFIAYMFACIFIFLSFFFAILSVAQSKADEQQVRHHCSYQHRDQYSHTKYPPLVSRVFRPCLESSAHAALSCNRSRRNPAT
jgi:hypothetical protein